MEDTLGKMVLYSLSTELKINFDDLYNKAKEKGVEVELIPTPIPKNRASNVIEVKEVRRSIAKAIDKNNGLLLRKNGGVAFLPQDNLSGWLRYEETINCGDYDGVEIVMIDVNTTAENKKVIIKALIADTKEHLKDEIWKINRNVIKDKSLKDMVNTFIVVAKENKININAMHNIIGRLDEMFRKVKMYEGYINVDLSYLKDNLRKAKKEFVNIALERQQDRYASW